MSEKEIIKGCQKEKRRFQEALVKRYSPMLMTVCRRYAPDEHLCWDILQESLINILRALPNYQPTGSFEAWMRRIVVTTALKYLNRKHWKWEPTEYGTEANISTQIPDHLEAEDLIQLISQLPNGF